MKSRLILIIGALLLIGCKQEISISPEHLSNGFDFPIGKPGWAMSDNLSTGDTIIPAWNMAVKNNQITKELIFHSDRGTQYASYRFTNILKSHNGLVKQSMSRKGNCWDNAIAESFFKSLKVEWVYKL
jgi:transposase InsO family protein